MMMCVAPPACDDQEKAPKAGIRNTGLRKGNSFWPDIRLKTISSIPLWVPLCCGAAATSGIEKKKPGANMHRGFPRFGDNEASLASANCKQTGHDFGGDASMP